MTFRVRLPIKMLPGARGGIERPVSGTVLRSSGVCSLAVALTAIGCASASQRIVQHVSRGEYSEARTLLEKEGAGEQLKPSVEHDLIEARAAFTARIEKDYGSELERLRKIGLLRLARSKASEGLNIVPWSD